MRAAPQTRLLLLLAVAAAASLGVLGIVSHGHLHLLGGFEGFHTHPHLGKHRHEPGGGGAYEPDRSDRGSEPEGRPSPAEDEQDSEGFVSLLAASLGVAAAEHDLLEPTVTTETVAQAWEASVHRHHTGSPARAPPSPA